MKTEKKALIESNKTQRLLRLILYLSNSYSKTKDECIQFLGVKDSAFYNYRNELIEIGFNVVQKEGRYWIDNDKDNYQVLQNILHFTEEESWLLSKAIDLLDTSVISTLSLKRKLTQFLNYDKAVEAYLQKQKTDKVQLLASAIKSKKLVLLKNYASGNSQTVKNRLVEPFEFREDFNLLWAFDTSLMQNRQFKISRMEDVEITALNWEHARLHQSMPVDVFRNTGQLDKELELVLTLKARNLLIEEYPLSEKFLERLDPSKYLLKVRVAKYEGPCRFVLGLADEIEVIGDPLFLEFIHEKMKKMQSFYFDSTISGVQDVKFDKN